MSRKKTKVSSGGSAKIFFASEESIQPTFAGKITGIDAGRFSFDGSTYMLASDPQREYIPGKTEMRSSVVEVRYAFRRESKSSGAGYKYLAGLEVGADGIRVEPIWNDAGGIILFPEYLAVNLRDEFARRKIDFEMVMVEYEIKSLNK